MTLLESIHKYLSQNTRNIPPGVFFMIEDNDKLEESVLITPYDAGFKEDGLPVGRPRFQIKNRAKWFPRSDEMSWDLFQAVENMSLKRADRRVLDIDTIQEPSYLGKDDGGRHVYVFNVEVVAAMKGA